MCGYGLGVTNTVNANGQRKTVLETSNNFQGAKQLFFLKTGPSTFLAMLFLGPRMTPLTIPRLRLTLLQIRHHSPKVREYITSHLFLGAFNLNFKIYLRLVCSEQNSNCLHNSSFKIRENPLLPLCYMNLEIAGNLSVPP